ncbi:MAG: hypothetical protein SFU87_08860 [Chitinophagaceae bacterium]|nr:hypothetical protein [Chitinophagaceae bacterium]
MKLYVLISILFAAGLYSKLTFKIKEVGKPAEKKANTVFCAPSFDPSELNVKNAPLFKGLGNTHFKVTTSSKKAQQYFNQGLALLFAFNHVEAGRSFKAAIENDPSLAMAYWGLGMVLGPNYNAALNPSGLTDINDAMERAVKLSGNTSAKEKALINALAKRFPKEEVKDMAPFNAAYANAMKEAYDKFPDDAEVAVIYADALMNEHPWNLWLKGGDPQPWTPHIMATLENILARWPNHPSAIHLYIHATEASANPEKALPYADKLAAMMPSAGHIVHMPSHTYIRTGDYHKGVLVNEKASMGDSNYVAQCKVQGFYALLLYPHNIHFLAACAFLEGNSKKAIDAAWMVQRKADKRFLADNITVQHYYSIPFYVLVQLGKWDEIMKLNEPGESLLYPRAVWHYARGMAFAARGKTTEAESELDAINEIAKNESLKAMLIWENNSAAQLVNIALTILSAQIEAAKKNYGTAVGLLQKAVEMEDALTYQEPPDWFFSVRQTLGHWLVQAGQYEEAEKIYRQDLTIYKENGWSLMGLYNSLKGQNKNAEVAEVKKRFEKAWQWADVKIYSSRVY